MKFLITVMPQISHVMLAKAIAKQITHAGHLVAVASSKTMQRYFDGSGLEYYVCGYDHDGKKTFGQSWIDKGLIKDADKPGIWMCAAEPMVAFLDDLIDCTQKNKPDVIIRFQFELAGNILADLYQIKDYELEFTFPIPDEQKLSNWQNRLNTIKQKRGLQINIESDSFLKSQKIRCLPPLWYTDTSKDEAIYIDLQHDDKMLNTDDNFAKLFTDDKKIVVCSLGTMLKGREKFLQAICDQKELCKSDYRLILTTGPDVDPQSINAKDEDTHILSYIPHSLALAKASLLISHGGFGTIKQAMNLEVPHLVLNVGSYDSSFNGNMLNKIGVGNILDSWNDLEKSAAIIDDMLNNTKYLSACKRLSDQMKTSMIDTSTFVEKLQKQYKKAS